MELKKLNIDRNGLILHVIFWSTWVVLFTVIQSLGLTPDQWLVWLLYYIITLPVFIIHTYLIAYWLVPVTFFKGQYIFLVLGLFVFLMVFSILELVVSNELVFKFFDRSRIFEPGYLNLRNIFVSGIGNHYIILVFLAIKAGWSWYSVQNKKEELLRTKLETDLDIYRYQLQPKLIYSLLEELEEISKRNPSKTPEMIVNISNFLNRFLFESKEELLPLQLEVELIQDFLEIHKNVLGDRFTSNFIVNGAVKSFVVPPLLLIPFINSAIKLVYQCNNSYESTVIIKAEKKYVLFSFSFWSENEFRLSDHENIEITKKRLNYAYPGKHRLIENMDENFREVSLEIFY